VLSDRADGGHVLREKTGETWSFAPDGALESIQDADTNRLNLSYADSRITRIEHQPSGQGLDLTYRSDGRLIQVADSTGHGWSTSTTGMVSIS